MRSATPQSIWPRLGWLGVFAIAMGLLEAICVIYLRRLLPVEKISPVPALERLRLEVIRETCTIVMLVSVAWLTGFHWRSRVACFFYAFGIWDVVYYVGLWWLAGWPQSLLTWDCLFLIPKPWHGPVLAPVLISLYFILGCCWLHAREAHGKPMSLSPAVIASQLVAFAVWYWSFVKDADRIAAQTYVAVHYSWLLFSVGTIVGVAGLWHATRPRIRSSVVAALLTLLPFPIQSNASAPDAAIKERQQIEHDLTALAEKLAATRRSTRTTEQLDLFADAELFHKGVAWALRYDTNLTATDIALIKKALTRGSQRIEALQAKQTPWTTKKGKVLRGFVSAVDGSTQCCGVIVPAGYDGTKPMRLDVVLHGSSKPIGMSELRFGARFDEGDDAAKSAPDVDFIELHPLGRVENCYRWAGETDVFEAIEAVCRNYRIDRDRIVLRGMSMGASGTWHLGLKHPDRFVAIGPYCGYVDTHRFSETPMKNFIRVGPLPPHQERALHMLDSVDYAANAGVVPAIGAIGDKDVFFQAHVIMGEAMAREGLEMVNLISRGTGHVIDPATHAEQMRRIGEYASKGRDHTPRQLRFVTWTLKYNRCHWLELLALGQHYERAEISANVADDGSIAIAEPRNITRFAILPPMLRRPDAKLRIGGVEIALPQPKPTGALTFAKEKDGWKCIASTVLTGKRPGLQGPIDDAFATPFLCMRGTGAPWNAAIGAWADANLRRFAYEWARYMRGNLPVKDDTAVTDEDVRTKHLILFGDPGSNVWIRKALPGLPLTWTRNEVRIGNVSGSAGDHAPALICASPLPGAGEHYIVLNSGHTFHESEFAAFNYLLFPRLGDWAVMKIGAGADAWQPKSTAFPEEIIRAGFFNEDWKTTP